MRPDRQNIYDAVIRRMVTEALAEKEARFAAEHAQDTDERLIAYLRQQAKVLRHSPHAKEIIGWQYILERFGTWENALRRAGLRRPDTPNNPSQFLLVIEETALQQELYRKKRAQKKQQSQIRRQQQEKRERERKMKSTV